jgi:hypothetical protein
MNLRFHHVLSDRDFPARTVDVSDGGLLMQIPATAPLQEGHVLRFPVGEQGLADVTRDDGATMEAKVIRVEHNQLLQTGKLSVGVEFERRHYFMAG